ncbi:hypothetical protein Droror1_Dr00022203 [Drosera rotundifolia]
MAEDLQGLDIVVQQSSFSYSGHLEGEVEVETQSYMLETLEPHLDLEKIRIEGYRGTRFPDWLGKRSYNNVVHITLWKCWVSSSSSIQLPLGRLRSLKHLKLHEVRNITKLGFEFYGCNDPFPTLEELSFSNMEEWEDWETLDAVPETCLFPHLNKLELRNCPRLKGVLPDNLPSLEDFSIQHCPNLISFPMLVRGRPLQQLMQTPADRDRSLSTLACLEIASCGPNLVNSCLVNKRLHSFQSLQTLTIEDCDSVEYFPAIDTLPSSLTHLTINNFVNLKRLDGIGLQSLTRLEELWIESCPQLHAIAEEGLPGSLVHLLIVSCDSLECYPHGLLQNSLTKLSIEFCLNLKRLDGFGLRSLTCLQKLDICYCPQLEFMPAEGFPCSLTELTISDCHPSLKERCREHIGQDWPKIAHIPKVCII